MICMTRSHEPLRQSRIIEVAKVFAFAAIIRPMLTLTTLAIMPNKEKEKTRRIFARNFKRAREDAELTQEAVAKIMGWTQPFMSDIENGKKGVSLDNAAILADVVKQPLCKLLSTVEK